ncbi:conserved protein, unknown function [Hepatocystis sp. ex Piliocolobus tephrosceles]|nr:conserved protein, unknown function [Hepatocystis sp. ex Piliocolobus tephrosceles]
MKKLYGSKNDDSMHYDKEKIINEMGDNKVLILPTCSNTYVDNSSLRFQSIKPSYFITNNLNNAYFNDENKHITFEKEHDEKKNMMKKKFFYDLSEEQRVEVEKLKTQKIIQNEMYLKRQKVLKYVIQFFLSDLLKDKPENVYEYAAEYFTRPNLKQQVVQNLKNMLTKS